MSASNNPTTVRLKRHKAFVETVQEEQGLGNFAEALRYIIDDYSRMRTKLDQLRTADFEKVCDLLSGKNTQSFIGAVIEDLSAVKSEIGTIKQMMLVLAVTNEKSKMTFAEYWPEYFK